MKIYISSDHGGFDLKNELKEKLQVEGFDVTDLGPFELDTDDDYPDYAFPLAKKVAQEEESLGILICRSGNGMVIAANKVTGARGALCFTLKHAQMARSDDAANILCLDADYTAGDEPSEIVNAFVKTNFEGWESRHGRRVRKIIEFEKSKTV